MRRFVLVFFSTLLLLCASATQRQQQIYTTILDALFPTNQVVLLWVDDPSKKALFESIERVEIVSDKNNADILIVSKTYDLEGNHQIVFADGYLAYKHNKKHIVGGFYWQKGRPNLVFLKKNLQQFNIELPKNLQEFVEDDL